MSEIHSYRDEIITGAQAALNAVGGVEERSAAKLLYAYVRVCEKRKLNALEGLEIMLQLCSNESDALEYDYYGGHH